MLCNLMPPEIAVL